MTDCKSIRQRKLTAPKRIGGHRLPLKIVSDVPACKIQVLVIHSAVKKGEKRTSVYKCGDNLDSIWCCCIGVDLWNSVLWVGGMLEPSIGFSVRFIARLDTF